MRLAEKLDWKGLIQLIYYGGLYKTYIFFVAPQPQWGHGFLIVEVSRSHSAGHTTVSRAPLDG
jgi:hypothetical protein